MSAEYTYRRKLRASELMPALAAGVGVGLVVFYFTRLFLQRTPVLPQPEPADDGPEPPTAPPSGAAPSAG